MSGFFAFFRAIDRILVPVLKVAVLVLGLFVAFTIVIGVVARSVFDVSLFGSEELILVAAIWLYMLGATLASRERSHLGGDFVQMFIENRKLSRAVKVVAAFVSLAMAFFFLICAFIFVSWSIDLSPVTPVFGMPRYIAQSSLLVASVLMFSYAIKDFIKDVVRYQKVQS